MYPRSSARVLLRTGVGTKARRAFGIPLTFTTDATSRENTSACTPTAGTPKSVSSVIVWPETSGAHVLQRPTPRMQASPSVLI